MLQGAAARYIAVDFAVPNPDSALHDITVDPRGVAWVNELNQYKLGRFDPKTYEFTQIDPPARAEESRRSQSHGSAGARRRGLDLDGRCRRQPPLVAVRHQDQEFTAYPAPDDFKGPISGNTMRADPNGKMVWSTAGTRIVGLNIQTKQFVAYDIPHWVETKQNPGAYGLDVAGDGRVWFVEREANKIGRLDPATGKIDEFPTPGIGHSAPDGSGLGGQSLGRLP